MGIVVKTASLPVGEIEDLVLRQIRDLGQDTGVIRDTLAQTRSQTHQQEAFIRYKRT